MDGTQLCRTLRSAKDIQPRHFIMLTVHSERERLLAAYDAGIDDFISKPFDQGELLARVRASVRSVVLQRQLVTKVTDLQSLNAELAVATTRLQQLSITDELTGLFNRRHAMAQLSNQWCLSSRDESPLTIAIVDVDHFKSVNDRHGHQVGDEVLRRTATLLMSHAGESDLACRVGGDGARSTSAHGTLPASH